MLGEERIPHIVGQPLMKPARPVSVSIQSCNSLSKKSPATSAGLYWCMASSLITTSILRMAVAMSS